MKRLLACSLLAVAVALAAGVSSAQTYDVSQYLLVPGLAVMHQNRVPGNSQPVSRQGVHVVQAGQYFFQHEYYNDGSGWKYDGFSLFKLTATHIEVLGWQDAGLTEYSVHVPPLQIPRSLPLNTPVTYKGTTWTERGNFPTFVTFVLTADNITKKTPGGTFNNCLKFKYVEVKNMETWTTSALLAKAAGEVFTIESGVDETEPEVSLVGSEIGERIPFKFP